MGIERAAVSLLLAIRVDRVDTVDRDEAQDGFSTLNTVAGCGWQQTPTRLKQMQCDAQVTVIQYDTCTAARREGLRS